MRGGGAAARGAQRYGETLSRREQTLYHVHWAEQRGDKDEARNRFARRRLRAAPNRLTDRKPTRAVRHALRPATKGASPRPSVGLYARSSNRSPANASLSPCARSHAPAAVAPAPLVRCRSSELALARVLSLCLSHAHTHTHTHTLRPWRRVMPAPLVGCPPGCRHTVPLHPHPFRQPHARAGGQAGGAHRSARRRDRRVREEARAERAAEMAMKWRRGEGAGPFTLVFFRSFFFSRVRWWLVVSSRSRPLKAVANNQGAGCMPAAYVGAEIARRDLLFICEQLHHWKPAFRGHKDTPKRKSACSAREETRVHNTRRQQAKSPTRRLLKKSAPESTRSCGPESTSVCGDVGEVDLQPRSVAATRGSPAAA